MILNVGKEWLDKCRNCENLRTTKQDGRIIYRACKANECVHCAPNENGKASEPITPFIHVTVNHPEHGECDGWLDKERRVLFVEAMPTEYAKEILKWTWREDND